MLDLYALTSGGGLFVLQAMLALLYFTLVLHKRTNAWWLIAVVFAVLALALRAMVPLEEVRDFQAYFQEFAYVRNGGFRIELLYEPYRLVVFEAVHRLYPADALEQIGVVYGLHFLAVTGIFLWLAQQRQSSAAAKLVLFLAFYPPIAFVWLQAGMAYMMACLLFLIVGHRGGRRLLHFTPILIHAALAPLVVALETEAVRRSLRIVAILGMAVVGYGLFSSQYGRFIFGSVDHYATTSGERTSEGLLIFHVANMACFGLLIAHARGHRLNFSVWALMAMTMAAYFVNPVISLRFFPMVLVAFIVQQIPITRDTQLAVLLSLMYAPLYFLRFDQIWLPFVTN